MADALCSKDSHAACLDVLVDELFRCSGCCDFFDECYNQCEGEFGGYYILEDDDGYEPTLDTSGRGDRCFGADDGGSGATRYTRCLAGTLVPPGSTSLRTPHRSLGPWIDIATRWWICRRLAHGQETRPRPPVPLGLRCRWRDGFLQSV